METSKSENSYSIRFKSWREETVLWDLKNPPYNTWTEEITFVSSYGGTATPTWHLAGISANTSSNLVIAQRTNTNDLIITLGPIKCPRPPNSPPPPKGAPPTVCPPSTESPVQLVDSAMNQHNARVQA